MIVRRFIQSKSGKWYFLERSARVTKLTKENGYVIAKWDNKDIDKKHGDMENQVEYFQNILD